MASIETKLALTRAEAAELCGLTPSGFDRWVRRGIVPEPIPRTRRWSRAALAMALGADVPGQDAEEQYRRWKARQAQAPLPAGDTAQDSLRRKKLRDIQEARSKAQRVQG